MRFPHPADPFSFAIYFHLQILTTSKKQLSMLFTSQYFTIGQQVVSTCPTPRFVFSMYAMNWHYACICPDQAGAQAEQSVLPGIGEKKMERERKSNAKMLAQNLFSMKNARKQLGEIASKDATQINPGPIVSDNPDALSLFENQVFHEKQRPRQPESPDVEPFRSWLKTNTPRHKASQALLERIKLISHDDKL